MRPTEPAGRALVVDDTTALRRLLCEALHRAGLDTVEATDGADAWRKLAGGGFDVVLTDVNMPKLDGLKLVSMIRGGAARRDLPVVILTTEGKDPDRARAMAAGASAYLVKPVHAEEVVATVTRLLVRDRA